MDIVVEKLNACSEKIAKSKALLECQVNLSEKLKKARDAAEEKFDQVNSIEKLKVI